MTALALVRSRRPLVTCSGSFSRQLYHLLRRDDIGYQKNAQKHHFSSVSDYHPGEKLRVAIVGGGAAGLSAALQFAQHAEAGRIETPIDIYESHSDECLHHYSNIGVGLWSPSLEVFRHTSRESHELVLSEMVKHGRWVGDVGYRTPSGSWLMKSRLSNDFDSYLETGRPALLFLRENDMLMTLRKAVHIEEQRGMVKVRQDGGTKTKVVGLDEQSTMPLSSRLAFDHERFSERDYHLVIAADGMKSVLRSQYGGYNEGEAPHLTGTTVMANPLNLPQQSQRKDGIRRELWDDTRRLQSIALQDRNYTVFRGNSPLSNEETGVNGQSFQTWGTGDYMRFATVPLLIPGPNGKLKENQVWFATVNDDRISSNPDPVERRNLLVDKFQNWHDPICRMMEATPAEDILVERAIAHNYCMGPVLSFNEVVRRRTGIYPPNGGQGPCIVFLGDAFMTVDPILAQGFSVAMEGAYYLQDAVTQGCIRSPTDPLLMFDPVKLRAILRARHNVRMGRIVKYLRATELVQALGQPAGGPLGVVNTNLLRPIIQVTPNFIKAPIFDAVMKYSLGLNPIGRA